MNENCLNLLTVNELCDVLGISGNTAYELLNTKQIKALRIGRIWKIPVAAVNSFILENSNIKLQNS